jgi:DNA polymerase-1
MEEYDTLLEVSDNPLAKQITEYRGWQKAVTSLYEPLLVKVGPDGRVRTEFHQHRAVTGRLSSSNPNLQQIPRSTSKPWNGNAKSCFTAGLGSDWALYGWDYSQIELRLAAAYGDEKLLLTEFNENEQADPFSVLAPLVFGSLTPETRYWTKNRFVYPSIYGAGFNKICLTLGMSPEEARPLYDNYQAAIPGITYAAKQVSRVIEQRGYVKYWDGRRRHIRNKTKSYKGFNAVCQGGSAQLMKKAMLRCQSFENPDECFMVLTVHDEIVFCIRRELIEKYEPLVREAMTDWPLFGVKLTIEGKEWK